MRETSTPPSKEGAKSEWQGGIVKRKAIIHGSVIAAAIVLALLLPSGTMATNEPAAASVPALVTYQGYLVDAGGDPIDGQVDIRAGIYPSASGGLPLWQETHASVDVADGYFTIYLGSVTALDSSLFDAAERWLQISVDFGSGYNDLPRQQATSVPYALRAEEAASAPWAGLSGVPGVFPPEGHTHDWADVTGEPAYTTRWPTWEEVTGKPSAFPPASHNHDSRYYTEGELSGGGAGGQVHWDNVTNVDYANDVQQRVTGTCAAGFYMRGVNANGSVVCEEVPGMPAGTIVMWSGSIASIPDGWALCDGTGGAPDLTDRFVVGAGDAYSVGATGGVVSHTLTVDEMPAHDHGGGGNTSTGGEHTHSLSVKYSGNGSLSVEDASEVGLGRNGLVGAAGNHSHSYAVESEGGGQPHENRPPYYALAFIIKVAE